MSANEIVKLLRDTELIEIPAGYAVTLPAGTDVRIQQALGGSYTLYVPAYGQLFRLSSRHADAIGKEVPADPGGQPQEALTGEALENRVWEALKTCYDPEIPVNIVDLGLVYEMKVSPLEGEANRVDVKMTLTAQGCGMGASIAYDAKTKILDIPGIKEAEVDIVWEPAWSAERISADGKAVLGIA